MAGLIPFNRRDRAISPVESLPDFNDVLDDFFSTSWPLRRNLTADTFKMDVADTGKEYVIEAELPGIDKKDVDVKLDEDGKLTVSVTRDEQAEEKGKNFIHRERRFASMTRSVYLAEAKPDGVQAKLRNGVLQVIVPKEERSVRSVKVDVG